MKMVITKAGRAALVNASQSGTAAVVVSEIGVGSGKYTATESQTALVSEIKRMPVIEGGQTGDSAIHVAMQDAGADAYVVYELGVFLADGTLLAVYSQTEPIANKAATSELLLALDAVFVGVDVSAITFGNVSYGVAVATEANAGVMTLATVAEAVAGKAASKAITPAALAAVTATTERRGLVALATEEEAKTGTDDRKAVTPAALRAATDVRAATFTEVLQGTSEEKFVTPLALKQYKATSGRAGLVELATEEEAVGGIDDKHVLTPATAVALFSRLIEEWEGKA